MKHLLLAVALLLAGCSTTYRPPDLENQSVIWMADRFGFAEPPQPIITYDILYQAHLTGIENQLQLWQLNQKYRPMVDITWRLR